MVVILDIFLIVFFFPLYNGIKLPVVANDDLSSSITLREIIELNGAN
jgi:hypothetical protein